MFAEIPLLWCAGVVHKFAESDVSRDQATALSVIGASWAFSLPKTLGLLGLAWQRVWHSNALVPSTGHVPRSSLHMGQLPVSP